MKLNHTPTWKALKRSDNRITAKMQTEFNKQLLELLEDDTE